MTLWRPDDEREYYKFSISLTRPVLSLKIFAASQNRVQLTIEAAQSNKHEKPLCCGFIACFLQGGLVGSVCIRVSGLFAVLV